MHARALAEFKADRFGMFIHWGLYSIPARGEWEMQVHHVPSDVYAKYMTQFNPTQWNADRMVEIAERAGMKYIDITTKHHDGFCMFDSQLTDYKITNTPFHRDVIREFVDACHRHGIKIIFYYSLLDWHHPDYVADPEQVESSWAVLHRHNASADWNRYIAYYQGQVRELLTNYGHIDGILFDGGWNRTDWHVWKLDETFAMIHQLQPWALINNHDTFKRTPPGEDYESPEQNLRVAIQLAGGGLRDPERQLGLQPFRHPLQVGRANDSPYRRQRRPWRQHQRQHRTHGEWRCAARFHRPAGRCWTLDADQWRVDLRHGERALSRRRRHTYLGTTTRKGNRVFLHVLNWPYKVLEVKA